MSTKETILLNVTFTYALIKEISPLKSEIFMKIQSKFQKKRTMVIHFKKKDLSTTTSSPKNFYQDSNDLNGQTLRTSRCPSLKKVPPKVSMS